MSVVAALVIQFGEGADSSALVKMEWDEVLNVDAAGEGKSSFAPGDPAYFFIHHAPTLRIGRVAVTHGQIVKQAMITRTRKQELDFVEVTDGVELEYLPAGPLTTKWCGNAGVGLKRTVRKMGISGGDLPALAQVSYPIAAQGYKVITPEVALAEGESYPIKVYAWMEAA